LRTVPSVNLTKAATLRRLDEKKGNTMLQTIIENQISLEQSYIAEHEEIKAILLPLEGKPINGQTLNQKRLGEKFKLKESYGMFYMVGDYEHLIGYKNSENIIHVSGKEGESRGFEHFDACHGSAAQKRINQLQAVDSTKAAEIFSTIQTAFETLKTAFGDLERNKLTAFHFPAYYEALRTIQGEQKEIELNRFYHIRK